MSNYFTNNIFLELGVLKLKDLIEYNQIVLGHGIWHETLPDNIRSNLDKLENIDRGTRASLKLNFKIPFIDKVSVHSLKQQLHTSAITPSTKDFQEVYIEYQITHSIPESSVLNNVKTITGDVFEVSIKKVFVGALPACGTSSNCP